MSFICQDENLFSARCMRKNKNLCLYVILSSKKTCSHVFLSKNINLIDYEFV